MILLSAYACEPQKGSEPMVGWNHVLEYAKKGHCVHVITRTNNRPSIENYCGQNSLEDVSFEYYDLPGWLVYLKKGKRGVYAYYLLWQIGIYFLARRLVKTYEYDFIHHVTFVSVRQPSFLGLLEPPFIFGPVGGGEHATKQLRSSLLSYRVRLYEFLRDISNRLIKFDPLMYLTFKTASLIYATSNQTLRCIPRRFRKKARVELGVGIQTDQTQTNQGYDERDKDKIRLLYAGQLIYWKGVHLTILAAKTLMERNVSLELTIVGSGKEENALRKLAEKESVDHLIRWIPWLPRDELLKSYSNFDCFLYPSLHDSGGFVVLEALSCGLPVVCLDIGGPGKIVDESCGAAVNVEDRSVKQLTETLADEILNLHQQDLKLACFKRAKNFAWGSLTSRILSDFEEL